MGATCDKTEMYMQRSMQHWKTPLMMPSILVKSDER